MSKQIITRSGKADNNSEHVLYDTRASQFIFGTCTRVPKYLVFMSIFMLQENTAYERNVEFSSPARAYPSIRQTSD